MELYEHQKEAFERFKDSTEIALFFEMGCLSYDTEVDIKLVKPAVNKVKRINIRSLAKIDPATVRVKSMVNGKFVYMPIKGVIDKGTQKTLKITAENGKSIVCTHDHEFYTEKGWARADKLDTGMAVFMNGCKVCGSERNVIKRIASNQYGLCLSCARKETNRKYKEPRYKLSKEGYIKVQGDLIKDYPGKHCSDGSVLEHHFVYWKETGHVLDTGTETIHHKNEIRTDNRIENLQLMTIEEHNKHHSDTNARAIDGTFLVKDLVPDLVRIKSIEEHDEMPVADIAIDDVDVHNFVANGFVVHNCGKSATALKIAEHKALNDKIDQVLIIAPNDVHKQWAKEQIPQWFDATYSISIYGGRGGDKEFHAPDTDGYIGFVCVNIDTFSLPDKWKPVVEWAKSKRTMIILDEATSIKNVTSKRTQRLLYEFNYLIKKGKTITHSSKLANTEVRCVLTGTPVTNGPMDLWAIMEFVKPNFFNRNWYSFKNYYGMFTKLEINGRIIPILLNEGSWHAIKRMNYTEAAAMFCISEDTYMTIHSQKSYLGPYKHADELKSKLGTTAIFKKLTECVDMPKQLYDIKYVGMSPAQEATYKNMVKEFVAQYDGHTSTALNKLTLSTRLQQISSGFIVGQRDIVEEDEDLMPDEVVWLGETCPKLDALIRDVAESDKPMLILTKYSAEAAKIYDLLSKEYSTMLWTGWKHVGSLDKFKEGEYDICVANINAIARGFNLQVAHTILFYSNTYSMEMRQQAEFRTFRIGQENPCYYIDYVASPIEEQISKALVQKKNLLEYMRSIDNEFINIIKI